jgi:glutaredoxin
MKKRTIEVFTAGCPCCDEAVQLVKTLACESCDVQVLDMRSDRAAQARAKEYGVQRVPAIVVNGRLADCCQSGAVDAAALRRLGVGSPA